MISAVSCLVSSQLTWKLPKGKGPCFLSQDHVLRRCSSSIPVFNSEPNSATYGLGDQRQITQALCFLLYKTGLVRMITSSLSYFGGGFDEIVHINVWHRMLRTKLGKVRDLNSAISQILTECLLCARCWARDWREGMGLSCMNDLC